MTVRAPFPYFGGKHDAAPIVWAALGDVRCYVEPFAGSAAVLLRRPIWHKRRYEAINDADGLVSNFWRAMVVDPEAVIAATRYPVHETEFKARHAWARDRAAGLVERLSSDVGYCDAELAGWWVWGQSLAMGSERFGQRVSRPDKAGSGIHSPRGKDLDALAARLRGVRVFAGGWERVVTGSLHSTSAYPAGYFFDPPYTAADDRMGDVYAVTACAHEVVERAVELAGQDGVRVVIAGYDGDYDLPGWTEVPWWKEGGAGYANRTGKNARRERLWLSPSCLPVERPEQVGLFEAVSS